MQVFFNFFYFAIQLINKKFNKLIYKYYVLENKLIIKIMPEKS